RQLDSLVTWAAARPVEQRPATAEDLLRAVRELTETLPAAVLDSRPRPREDADTSDVPRLTTSLDEVASELGHGPRSFPAGLLAGSAAGSAASGELPPEDPAQGPRSDADADADHERDAGPDGGRDADPGVDDPDASSAYATAQVTHAQPSAHEAVATSTTDVLL